VVSGIIGSTGLQSKRSGLGVSDVDTNIFAFILQLYIPFSSSFFTISPSHVFFFLTSQHLFYVHYLLHDVILER